MEEFDVISFTNIDDEDLVPEDNIRWGSKDYYVKAGSTKPYPRFLAEHFAKHLADKMLQKNNQPIRDEGLRAALIKRMLGDSTLFDSAPAAKMTDGERVAQMVQGIQSKVDSVSEAVEPFEDLADEAEAPIAPKAKRAVKAKVAKTTETL